MHAETTTERTGGRVWLESHSLVLLIAGCGLAAVLNELYALCFTPQYTIADWLINYTQGFVRRGLPGEVILLLAHATHLPPVWMTVIVQLAVYFVFLAGIYRLAKPLRRDALWYALLFSPATLPFMMLNVSNGCRKEVLLHAALVVAVLLILRRTPPVLLALVMSVFFAVLVLSHETLACCFPYFFAAVALGLRDLRRTVKVMAVPFLIAGVLENIVRHHLGTVDMAIGICRSIGGHWVGVDNSRNLCAGAIGYLSWSAAMYRTEELANLHYAPLYLLLAVLSLAPLITALVVMARHEGMRFEVKVIACTAALSAAASSPMFYLAIDWGRWIYMQTICLLVLILMAAQRDRKFLAGDAVTTPANPRKRLLSIAVGIYCVVWTLPVVGMEPMRWGYADIPYVLYSEVQYTRHYQHSKHIDRGF